MASPGRIIQEIVDAMEAWLRTHFHANKEAVIADKGWVVKRDVAEHLASVWRPHWGGSGTVAAIVNQLQKKVDHFDWPTIEVGPPIREGTQPVYYRLKPTQTKEQLEQQQVALKEQIDAQRFDVEWRDDDEGEEDEGGSARGGKRKGTGKQRRTSVKKLKSDNAKLRAQLELEKAKTRRQGGPAAKSARSVAAAAAAAAAASAAAAAPAAPAAPAVPAVPAARPAEYDDYKTLGLLTVAEKAVIPYLLDSYHAIHRWLDPDELAADEDFVRLLPPNVTPDRLWEWSRRFNRVSNLAWHKLKYVRVARVTDGPVDPPSDASPSEGDGEESEHDGGGESEARSGDESEARGDESEARSGDESEARSGDESEARSGGESEARSGDESEARSSGESEARSGDESEARSGGEGESE